MAVDTRDRRSSVLGFGLAALLVLPAPGTIDQPDRQHLAYSYRGIASLPPVETVGVEIVIGAIDREIYVSAIDREIVVPAIEREIVIGAKG